MKKLFFVMAAVAALLTSCSKDDTFGGPTRGKVTFEVSTPELATRAYGDGQTADNLYYAVYDVIENAMVKTNYATTDTTDDVTFGNDLKATVTIDLVEGRPYEVAFWAESANSPYIFNAEAKTDAEGNTVAEAKTVSYNPNTSLTANNEAYDAFFAYVPEDKVKVGQVVNVDLKRPFAQLNVATSDAKTAKELGVEVKATGIKVDAYTSFNLQTGAVSGKEELTFAMTDVDNDATTEKEYNIGTITANSKNYDWLTMNYILVNERETTDVTFLFEDTKGKADYERPYSSINVQRNYRTNIIGAILTDPTKFDVTIDKEFTTPDINEERGNSREVSTVDEINAALNTLINDSDPDNDINSVTLTGNITFGSTSSASLRDNSASLSTTTRAEASTDHITIPAGVSFTIDLNGYNITGTDNTEKSFGLIHTNGTLNIINSSSTESTIKLTATHNNGWSRYSSVISNNPGGLLTVGANVVIEHLGGTAMSYGIDNLTNGKGTSAITIIDGATIKSKYIAVRQFLNGVEATNELYVKSGSTLAGERSGIYFQSPSAKANTGKLVVENGATIGGAYLGITEGTTEWPVEVSIAASAVNNDRSKIESDDVPAGYSIVLEDGNYVVKEGYYVATADELQAALDVVPSGQTIHFVADITAATPIVLTEKKSHSVTIDGHNFKFNGSIKIKGNSDGSDSAGTLIKNINFESSSNNFGESKLDAFIWSNDSSNGSMWRYANDVTIDNCTFTAVADSDAEKAIVGAKFQQAYNIKITNSTATNMHSLLQAESCGSTVTVEDCKVVNGKNGVSFNNTKNAVIKRTEINAVVDGSYGVRHKGAVNNYALTVEDCQIEAFVPVLIRNMTATGYTATLSGENTLTANKTNVYQVVLCTGDYDGTQVNGPAAPTGSYTLTGAEGLNVYPTSLENGEFYASDNTSLNNAIAASTKVEKGTNVTVTLSEGEYVIPASAKGKTGLTIKGTDNPEDVKVGVTKVGTGGENCDYGFDGSTATLENVTITTNSSTYIGYARFNGTYKNCIINGTYTLYGNSVFEDCTFNVSGDVYNIWTWGAPTATFTGCTFNCDGKAMLLYGTADTKLTMNNCIFNDNGGLTDLKAAIEIGNDYGKSYELIVNNATVNGFEINDKGINTGTTLWANKNSMGTDKLNVVVDGVDVY